jgi:hypothetical protein
VCELKVVETVADARGSTNEMFDNFHNLKLISDLNYNSNYLGAPTSVSKKYILIDKLKFICEFPPHPSDFVSHLC